MYAFTPKTTTVKIRTSAYEFGGITRIPFIADLKVGLHWVLSTEYAILLTNWSKHALSPLSFSIIHVLFIEGGFRNCFFFFLKILSIYLKERESMHKHGMGEGERQREKEKQTPHWAESLTQVPSQDPEIMTWAEGRCLTNWATQMPLQITTYF